MYSGGASRLLTRICAEDDCNALMSNDWKTWLETSVGAAIRSEPGYIRQFVKKSASSDRALTTLTAARRVDGAEGTFRYFVLGDSPLYVLDDNNKIRESIGAETAGDSGVDGYVEIFPDGRVSVAGEPKQGTLKLEPGWRLVLASDYVSDGLVKPIDEARAVRDSMRQEKKEGGYAYVDGKTVPPSRIPKKAGETQDEYMARLKDKYDWHPWIESTHDNNLKHAEKVFEFQKSFAEDPEKFFEKYKDDATVLSELKGYHAKNQRSLTQLLDMTPAQLEAHVKDKGSRWKDDDLTIGVFGYARGEALMDATAANVSTGTIAGSAGTDRLTGGSDGDVHLEREYISLSGGRIDSGTQRYRERRNGQLGPVFQLTPDEIAELQRYGLESPTSLIDTQSRAYPRLVEIIRRRRESATGLVPPPAAESELDREGLLVRLEEKKRKVDEELRRLEERFAQEMASEDTSPDRGILIARAEAELARLNEQLARLEAEHAAALREQERRDGPARTQDSRDESPARPALVAATAHAEHGHDHHESWHLPHTLGQFGWLTVALGLGTFYAARFMVKDIGKPILHTLGWILSGDNKHPWGTFFKKTAEEFKKGFKLKGGGGGGGGHSGGGHGGGHGHGH